MAIAILASALGASLALAQDKEPPPSVRYGVPANLDKYPQFTPKETLASVAKAIDDRQIDYLLAHLADPTFVDERVKTYRDQFEELVREASRKMLDVPDTAKRLRRYLKEGEWEDADTQSSVKLKDLGDRVYLRKVGKRWFMENRAKKN